MNRLSLILFLIISFNLFSQNKGAISGFVYDSTTKEVIIGAVIYNLTDKTGTTSNEYGYYSLTVLKADTIRLKISMIGYIPKVTAVLPSSSASMNVFLTSGIPLKEVTISGAKSDAGIINNETGTTRLQMKEIEQLPNLFGEVDVIQALHFTPGVQSGGEGKSTLYVRGGSPDQNLILLDDVPLYYVGHFGGFFSVFNADAINDVKLIKGGFPARYGGRLSSVLDVRMKEGNMESGEMEGSAGLLSSKISVSTPLVKDKASFILSARCNVIPLFRFLGADMNYNFYDINAKANYILSDKDRIFLSFYKGDDVVAFGSKQDVSTYENKSNYSARWGNILGAFRWNHVYNKKLFSNLTVANTCYRFNNGFNYNYKSDTLNKNISDLLKSAINDASFKMDYSYFLNSRANFKFGINSIYHIFFPNNEYYKQSGTSISTIDSFYNSKSEALENACYLENNLRVAMVDVNIGMRAVSYYTGGGNFYSAEPRTALALILRRDLSLKYSFSKMNQYVHLLAYSGAGLPSDYWMPATQNVKPESAVQNSLGLYKTFQDEKFELTIEGYYKKLGNLVAFKPGGSLSGNLSNWENLVETNGHGENYGIELFLRKQLGKTTGWISGTVSKAKRQFDNLNNGMAFPFKYDRLIDVSVVAMQKIRNNIDLAATWNYGTGYPVTLATDKYQINGETVLVYDKINSFRMRDYHRLDIAANFHKKKKWGERTWTVSIFNLYNRQNPYYYYYDAETMLVRGSGSAYGQKGAMKLYQQSLFPFLPSIAYSFKFR